MSTNPFDTESINRVPKFPTRASLRENVGIPRSFGSVPPSTIPEVQKTVEEFEAEEVDGQGETLGYEAEETILEDPITDEVVVDETIVSPLEESTVEETVLQDPFDSDLVESNFDEVVFYPSDSETPGSRKDTQKESKKKKKIIIAVVAVVLTLVVAGVAGFFYLQSLKTVVPMAAKTTVRESNAACIPFVEADLECDVKWLTNDEVPSDNLISQSLEAGESVSKGSEIILSYSLGADKVTVPNFAGMTLEAAEESLIELGLELGEVEEVEDSQYPTNVVIGSSVEPGTILKNGESVDLKVSSGEFPMPDWMGKPKELVDVEAKDLHLNVTYIEQEDSGPSGVVLATDPVAGEIITSMDITVTVSVPKEIVSIEIPDVHGKTADEAQNILAEAGFTKLKIVEVPSSSESGVYQLVPGAGQKASSTDTIVIISLIPEAEKE